MKKIKNVKAKGVKIKGEAGTAFLPEKLLNEARAERQKMIQNGLSDVLGLNDSLLGFRPGSIGTPITQVDTSFINLRWYLISNMRQLISQMYVERGILKNVVDIPVDDGMRGGIEITTKQLSEEELQDLSADFERQDILNSVIGRAAKWNRLYGGAGILIMTDQNPEEPFDLESITDDTPLEFRAVDMWELFWDKQNTEGYNMELQEQNYEFYNYYAKKIHKSRVMKMKGITAPSFIRPRLRGWGISIYESILAGINPYLKSNNLVFELLDEAKVDVYKIKNLTSTLLSPAGQQALHQRLQIANHEKNYQHAITMDSEDDFIQKELSFTGIADTMRGIKESVACEVRMPLTKIFGVSAAGFNSGEDDIENYNGMVEGEIRDKTKYEILRIIEIMCQKKYGSVPTDLKIEFKPLRVMSSEQQENVKEKKFNRVLAARTAGEITAIEFRLACNKDQLLGISLDTSDTVISDLEAEKETESQGDDTGANKEDKQKAPQIEKRGGSVPKGSSTAKEAPKAKNAMRSDVDWEGNRPNEVVACGITHNGKILTGRRRDNGKWTFPAGHVNEGEDLREAMKREIKEEAGLEVEPAQLTPIETLRTKDRYGNDLRVHTFKMDIPNPTTASVFNDPDKEVAEWRWVNLSPDSPELQLDKRHALDDHVLNHFLGRKHNMKYVSAITEYKPGDDRIEFDSLKNAREIDREVGDEVKHGEDNYDVTYRDSMEEFGKLDVAARNALVNEAHAGRIQNPGKVDEGKWKKAKEAAAKESPENKWALTTYIYKKMGGTFQ